MCRQTPRSLRPFCLCGLLLCHHSAGPPARVLPGAAGSPPRGLVRSFRLGEPATLRPPEHARVSLSLPRQVLAGVQEMHLLCREGSLTPRSSQKPQEIPSESVHRERPCSGSQPHVGRTSSCRCALTDGTVVPAVDILGHFQSFFIQVTLQ